MGCVALDQVVQVKDLVDVVDDHRPAPRASIPFSSLAIPPRRGVGSAGDVRHNAKLYWRMPVQSRVRPSDLHSTIVAGTAKKERAGFR